MSHQPKTIGTKEDAKVAGASSSKAHQNGEQDAPTTLPPKLRFPEFRGAPPWDSDLLGNLAEMRSGGTPPSSVTQYYDGDIPWVSIADMTKAGKFITSTDRNLSRAGLEKCSAQIFPVGTVIFAMYASIGECAITRVPLCSSQAILGIRPSSVLDTEFLYCYLTSLKPRLKSLGQHGTQANLNKNIVQNLRFPLPALAEQQKIAECLSSVDELMAAQARKVDALKTHKKGLMQQLFPREGETQPRLRFPEFQNAGEWVQKTVGDVSEVLMCKRIFAEETNPSEGVPFYKIGTLGGIPDAFICREKFEDYKSRYNYPRTGEVLITCSGTVGKCLPFDGKDAYFQDSNIVWLDNPTGEVSNQFLLMLLLNVNWGSLNSTTITRIYGPDLRGMAIKYPEDEAEQQRIATCLSSLDALITAETQKLEALKTHKRGLTQQLFPSPEEVDA